MSSNFTTYRTSPNNEHRAANELRRAGIKAYVPRDRNRKRSPFTGKHPPTAPGYVFAEKDCDLSFAKHVRPFTGPLDEMGIRAVKRAAKREVGGLYLGRQRAPNRQENPFRAGDAVQMKGIMAKVTETRGRICLIKWSMLGKDHTQAIAYSQLKPG